MCCTIDLAHSVLAHSMLLPADIPTLCTGMGPSLPTHLKTWTHHSGCRLLPGMGTGMPSDTWGLPITYTTNH